MALVNILADFDRLIVVLERIDLRLQHGLRILEAAYPLKAAAEWGKPSDELHVVGDAQLLEREDEESRHKLPVSELGDEAAAASYDPWDLDTRG